MQSRRVLALVVIAGVVVTVAVLVGMFALRNACAYVCRCHDGLSDTGNVFARIFNK